jgi:hypothetical protein
MINYFYPLIKKKRENMKRVLVFLILLMVLGYACNDIPKYDLIIQNVNLIDGPGNPMIPNVTIFVN